MNFEELHAHVKETAEMVSERLGEDQGAQCRELLQAADTLLAASVTGTIDPGRALMIAATVICEAAAKMCQPAIENTPQCRGDKIQKQDHDPS